MTPELTEALGSALTLAIADRNHLNDLIDRLHVLLNVFEKPARADTPAAPRPRKGKALRAAKTAQKPARRRATGPRRQKAAIDERVDGYEAELAAEPSASDDPHAALFARGEWASKIRVVLGRAVGPMRLMDIVRECTTRGKDARLTTGCVYGPLRKLTAAGAVVCEGGAYRLATN